MSKQKIGAIQVFLAALCWSFSGVFSKWLPWSAFTIIGMRSITALVALGVTRKSFKVRMSKGNILGALGMCLTSVLLLMSMKLTTSANAIVLQYAMPVVVIGLCWIVYKQKPTAKDVVTSVFVLCGVILCSWKGLTEGGGRLLGDILGLLSAFTYALVFFCAKLPDTDACEYSYLGAIMCLPFSLYAFFDPNMTTEPVHFLGIAAMGLCLAGGYFFISLSLKNVSPVTSALLANLEPVLNPIWVFLFVGENPGRMSIIGAAVVIITVTVYSLIKDKKQDAGNA